MNELARAAARAQAILGRTLSLVSLGGSIFWDWWAEHHGEFACPPGCRVELRIADPILLGYDSYHEKGVRRGDIPARPVQTGCHGA